MLTNGSRVGSYEITGVLGAGGMGEVYRARDTKLNRDVAIKTLPARVAADPDSVTRFRREAHALASLSHPNIAAIFGLEESTDGLVALILELIEGQTLADRIARGPIPVAEALRFGHQIAGALEAAHERGIVHRDLKPANVMLTSDGRAKVVDFGLAKLADSAVASANPAELATLDPAATGRGMILGTTAYMAPEQAIGNAIDKRADIWAFGALLYEMLTGQRAFPGKDASEIFGGVIGKEPRWEALPPNTPAIIRRLLRRCLTKDLTGRLHDIADARLEIEDTLDASSEQAGSPAAGTSAGVGHRRLAVELVLLTAVFIVFGAMFGTRFFSSDESSPPAARAAADSTLPLVILMDSPNPARVYDQETLAANGTNADVISDVLSDLPIRRQKEAIGPDWHRDQEVRQFQPDLILIHFSGFEPAGSTAPRVRLAVLIRFFAETHTKFLIYSRLHEAELREQLDALFADLYMQHPDLRKRIRAFGVLDYGPPQWRNNLTSTQLKLAVMDMLGLQ